MAVTSTTQKKVLKQFTFKKYISNHEKLLFQQTHTFLVKMVHAEKQKSNFDSLFSMAKTCHKYSGNKNGVQIESIYFLIKY